MRFAFGQAIYLFPSRRKTESENSRLQAGRYSVAGCRGARAALRDTLADDASGSSSRLCGSGFQHERRHPPVLLARAVCRLHRQREVQLRPGTATAPASQPATHVTTGAIYFTWYPQLPQLLIGS